MRSNAILIEAMETAGWYLDEVSTDNYQMFHHEDGISIIQFYGWDEVQDWLLGVVFENEEISKKVDEIMNSEF